jgi:hypothetical protein
MACRPCRRTGEQLPDNVTCGRVCDAFPACLPPSPDLLERVRQLGADGQAKSERYETVIRSLEQLFRALTEGLEGQGQ